MHPTAGTDRLRWRRRNGPSRALPAARTLSSPATPLSSSQDPALAQIALIHAAVGMPLDHDVRFPNGWCGLNRMFHLAMGAGTIPLRYRTSTQPAWMAGAAASHA